MAMRFWHIATLALLSGQAPIHAKNWASAGGWEISEAGTDTCGMSLEYDGKGSTLLVLLLGTDGSVSMAMLNYGWSAVEKKAYELRYVVDGTSYSGADSIGVVDSGRKGFVSNFEQDFLTRFAASSALKVYTSEGVLVDSLNLSGSAAGLTQLRRCVTHLKLVAAAEAREKAKFAHIPDDPFSSGQPVDPYAPKPVVPILTLLSFDDYPPSSLKAGEQGKTSVTLKVGADGRVVDCQVTASSGFAALDATTCRILTSRARFSPARRRDGTPITGSYPSAIQWKIDGNEEQVASPTITAP